MAVIAVAGGGGVTGGLVVDELRRRGHVPVLLTRDAERARSRARDGAGPPDVGDPTDGHDSPDVAGRDGASSPDVDGPHDGAGPTEVAGSGVAGSSEARRAAAEVREVGGTTTMTGALAGCEAVIAVAGPYDRAGEPVLEAALARGVPYVDASLEPDFTARVQQRHERAREAGSVVVPAGGFPPAVLDLLGAVALGAVTGAEELHLATTLPTRRWLGRGTGPATREVLAALLRGPVPVRREGRAEQEGVGESRRLAWFPRPVGLAHAAAVPGTAVLSVTHRDPELATVREYLAMAGWRAELLQLAATATGWEPARRRLQRLVRGPGLPPVAARRAEVRWACVAETRGHEGTARAWANGRDPAATAAVSVVVLAEAALGGGAPGVRAPAELAAGGELLDAMSDVHDLRWSVVRP